MKKISLLKIIIFLLLLVSVVILSGCAEPIDKEKRIELDSDGLSFLCLRNIKEIYPNYSIRSQSWEFRQGLKIVDGEEEYARPYIKVQFNIYSEELGDDANIFERLFLIGTFKHSLTVVGEFYAFEGEVGTISYEFYSFDIKEKVLDTTANIYNNGNLVGKVYFISDLLLPRDYYVDILDKALIKVIVSKNNDARCSVEDSVDWSDAPDLSQSTVDILGLGNMIRWENGEILNYTSEFEGGYNFSFWHGDYIRAVNNVRLSYRPVEAEKEIDIKAEFYEYRGFIDSLEYEVDAIDYAKDDYDRVLNIYSNSILVGKVYYCSADGVTDELIKNIIVNNIIFIRVTK